MLGATDVFKEKKRQLALSWAEGEWGWDRV